jgi:hypothetical protein
LGTDAAVEQAGLEPGFVGPHRLRIEPPVATKGCTPGARPSPPARSIRR